MLQWYLILNVLLLTPTQKDQALGNASIAELHYFSNSLAIVLFEGESPYFPLKKLLNNWFCKILPTLKKLSIVLLLTMCLKGIMFHINGVNQMEWQRKLGVVKLQRGKKMLWKKIKELKGTYATYSKKKNQGKYFCMSLQTIKGIKSEKCFEISFLFCLRFFCFVFWKTVLPKDLRESVSAQIKVS